MHILQNSLIKDKWVTAHEKRKNDAYLNKFITPLAFDKKRKPIKVFSMPSINWIWEEQLIQAFPNNRFEFYGIERDRSKYILSCDRAEALNKEYKNIATFKQARKACSLKVALQTPDIFDHQDINYFDIVYADHMGHWCPNKLEEIVSIYSNDLFSSRKSMLIMTLGMNVRNSARFCFETRKWWESFKVDLDEEPEHIRMSHFVSIDDDHRHQRFSKSNYSSDIHELIQAITGKIVSVGHANKKLLDAHAVHLYYASRGKIMNCLPQASFCFTRII